MRKLLQKLSFGSALVALSFSAGANEASFKSADFAFSGEELLVDMQVDKLGASSVLYCRAEISKLGQANDVNCYTNTGVNNLIENAEQALMAQSFTPAEVAGDTVPVRMSFRLVFSASGSKPELSLIPNLGTMHAQFGGDYVAPQERLDVSDWYDRYTSNSWLGGGQFLGEGDMARVSAMVDQRGKPKRMQTVSAKRVHKRDAKIVANTLKHSRFIPGTVKGRAVPMDYMVAVHYGAANSTYAVK